MNYFALFDIDERYTLNAEILEQRYRVLQRLTHPDKYASATEQEQRIYLQKNAEINDAFHVLSDDVARGEHLLAIREVELPSEQETIGDTDFLIEQMELREALAMASNEQELEGLNRQVADILADYTDRITLLLNKNTGKDNHEAGLELSKLKFIKKLASEIKTRQQTISDY